MTQPDLASLPITAFEDVATLSARRSARWRPGLAALQGKALHSEIFASSREAAGAGAALALALDDWRCAPRVDGQEAEDRRGVLWVQTREAARLGGRPYRTGLPQDLQGRVIHVLAEKAEDALFALEEGLRCRELAFVIGEVAGNPKSLDFTASRRLTLTAQKHGVPLFLLRIDAARDLSSARMRWDVTCAPSAAPEWNAQAPGDPAWKAELFRARSHAPGEWVLAEKDTQLAAEKIREDADRAVANWTAGLQHRRMPRRA
ncbi:MAG: hypothetical protein HKO08_03695 [Erythrobacter sp.]|nr:hypothetical protein [Erythrobacter sp.]